MNGSQSVEVRSEKRRQQLMGMSFVAAAVGVLALLTFRLGTCCSWFGSHWPFRVGDWFSVVLSATAWLWLPPDVVSKALDCGCMAGMFRLFPITWLQPIRLGLFYLPIAGSCIRATQLPIVLCDITRLQQPLWQHVLVVVKSRAPSMFLPSCRASNGRKMEKCLRKIPGICWKSSPRWKSMIRH